MIVDDEQHAIDLLAHHINQAIFLKLVYSTTNAVEALEQVSYQDIDLIFLDVQMRGMNGLETAAILRTVVPETLIVFATAYDEYALRSFEFTTVDYLLKPISFERFLKAVNKVYDLQMSQQVSSSLPDYLFVKANQKLEKILFKDILYIEGVENYVSIQTLSGKIITHTTLCLMLKNLPEEQFVQTHKSVIVNIEQVSNVEGNMLGIDKYKVPVSRTWKEKTLEKILKNKLLKSF